MFDNRNRDANQNKGEAHAAENVIQSDFRRGIREGYHHHRVSSSHSVDLLCLFRCTYYTPYYFKSQHFFAYFFIFFKSYFINKHTMYNIHNSVLVITNTTLVKTLTNKRNASRPHEQLMMHVDALLA